MAKTRFYKRVYLIDVRKERFKGKDQLVEDIVFPFSGLLADLDRRDSGTLHDRQQEAKDNANKGATENIKAKEFINAKGYTSAMEPDYPHPGIHVSVENEDEIIWYSSEGLTFTVDVTCDPELVQVPTAGQKAAVQRALADLEVKNQPARDRPFAVNFPITSGSGKPVSSGPATKVADILDQRYYKYSITSANLPVLDPHIEFHED